MDVAEIRQRFAEINPKFVKRYAKIDDTDEFYIYSAKPLRPSIRVNTLKAVSKRLWRGSARGLSLSLYPGVGKASG